MSLIVLFSNDCNDLIIQHTGNIRATAKCNIYYVNKLIGQIIELIILHSCSVLYIIMSKDIPVIGYIIANIQFTYNHIIKVC